MPHSRYCALLFLGDPCSHSAPCSGHPKKVVGGGLGAALGNWSCSDSAKGQREWEPSMEQGPLACKSNACSVSGLPAPCDSGTLLRDMARIRGTQLTAEEGGTGLMA